MTENERFGLVFRENWVYKFGHYEREGLDMEGLEGWGLEKDGLKGFFKA
jgi:hypothetical protein